MEAALRALLPRIPGIESAPEPVIERLGGVTNENYRIIGRRGSSVLRLNGGNASRLGIDRKAELAALRSAHAAGLAPEPIALLEPEGHLVTRFIEGRHWSAEEFRVPERVRLLAETVRRVHALPSNGAAFSPFRRIEAFLGTARAHGAPLPPNLDACLRAMEAVEEEELDDRSDWRRLCHNDLACVNYLYEEGEGRILLLDWEFAGMGDLYYDLASVVFTHDSDGPLPPELEELLLSSYFGEVGPGHRRRLAGMKFVLCLFSGSWALAQHAMVKAGIIRPRDDFDYLDFAQWLFEGDIARAAGAL